MDENAITSIAAFGSVLESMPEHGKMVEFIQNRLPEVKRATSFFLKTQSQYMDNVMTVSHPTPLRNLRQILSEMTRTHEALQQAYFTCKKKEIAIKKKLAEKHDDPLDEELLQIEVMELNAQLETSRGYVASAIRKLANHQAQYDSIMVAFGKETFNEVDFEKEEPRFHVMKAFEQALCAARANGGVIDEGNHIYLHQVGVNGAAAQFHVTQFLIAEKDLLDSGMEPSFESVSKFLGLMADRYASQSELKVKERGMSLVTDTATLKIGDMRLINKHSEESGK
jgi:hypothetical protein